MRLTTDCERYCLLNDGPRTHHPSAMLTHRREGPAHPRADLGGPEALQLPPRVGGAVRREGDGPRPVRDCPGRVSALQAARWPGCPEVGRRGRAERDGVGWPSSPPHHTLKTSFCMVWPPSFPPWMPSCWLPAAAWVCLDSATGWCDIMRHSLHHRGGGGGGQAIRHCRIGGPVQLMQGIVAWGGRVCAHFAIMAIITWKYVVWWAC